MRLFGLIGYPLSHSFSKGYFADKFHAEDIDDCRYENFPLGSIGEFPDLIRSHSDLCGLNVTIPYKEKVIPYLDELDKQAAAVQAVNTIRFYNGRLIGYNTDIYGFQKSLEPLLAEWQIQQHAGDGFPKALVLGTGGASKAVAYVMEQFGIQFIYVTRKVGKVEGAISYNALSVEIVNSHKLIVNTTPLGMYPDTESMPQIPYDGIGEAHILFDLVYNPEVTRFLKEGELRSAVIKNGYDMLEFQAERAWAIWNDF